LGSWCGPCREENPELVKIYKEFRFKGFEIFGVATETDRAKWIKAINTDSLMWTNVSELNGSQNKAVAIYGITGYPTNYLINQSGIIIGQDLYGEDLRSFLNKMLE
jgi:thiol-disulfide isomerase/thioredoxin